jgi:hypothetical protein
MPRSTDTTDPPILPALSLESITSLAVAQVSDEPDPPTKLETEEIDIDHKRAELESFRQDTGERKRYAKNIFVLTCIWVGGIYVLMLLDGFGVWSFKLSNSIMLAAIGSTTANIVGVFLIVTRYFFPKKKL